MGFTKHKTGFQPTFLVNDSHKWGDFMLGMYLKRFGGVSGATRVQQDDGKFRKGKGSWRIHDCFSFGILLVSICLLHESENWCTCSMFNSQFDWRMNEQDDNPSGSLRYLIFRQIQYFFWRILVIYLQSKKRNISMGSNIVDFAGGNINY